MPSDLPMYANNTIPKKNKRNGIKITERTVKDRVSNIDTEDMMKMLKRTCYLRASNDIIPPHLICLYAIISAFIS